MSWSRHLACALLCLLLLEYSHSPLT
jgi:hypothetical protein